MMPPKAKAKAKARAGAVLRRPAHRRGGLRRPAGAGDGQSPWALGQEVDLHQVPPMELGPGMWLVASKANYFGATVKFAGEVVKLEVEQGEVTLQLRATGTDNEHVLRAHSAQPQQVFKGHVCPEGCGMQETGDLYHPSPEGKEGRPGSRRPVDQEPSSRKSGRGGGRRTGCSAGPIPGSPVGRPPRDGGASSGGAGRDARCQREGGEPGGVQEEEKEKGGEEKQRSNRRKISSGCRAEGPQRHVWRHRDGPPGKSETPGDDKSTEIHFPQKDQEQCRIVQQQQFVIQHHRGGSEGFGVHLHGANKGERSGRAIPRGANHGDGGVHAGGTPDERWRGNGGVGCEANGPPLLPVSAVQAREWSTGKRAAKHIDRVGSPPSRESSFGCGCTLPKAQSPGGSMPGHCLEHSNANGGATSRDGRAGRPDGVEGSSEGGLRGVACTMEESELCKWQGRWQDQRQGSQGGQGGLEERRDKTRQPREEGKRTREERVRSPEDSAYDRRSSSAKVRSPLPILGGKHARTCDQANLKSLGRGVSDKVAGGLVPGPKHFPSVPPRFCAGGATAGSDPALVFSPIAGNPAHDGLGDEPAQADMPKKNGLDGLIGKRVHELGFRVYQLLLEVLPLRGSSMGKRNSPEFFPLTYL